MDAQSPAKMTQMVSEAAPRIKIMMLSLESKASNSSVGDIGSNYRAERVSVVIESGDLMDTVAVKTL